MASNKKKTPNLLEDNPFDPVSSATGPMIEPRTVASKKASVEESKKISGSKKKKVGFYLPVDILERFNRKFHTLKLEGLAIENKSALLEAGLCFALDDMDKNAKSRILKTFAKIGDS